MWTIVPCAKGLGTLTQAPNEYFNTSEQSLGIFHNSCFFLTLHQEVLLHCVSECRFPEYPGRLPLN